MDEDEGLASVQIWAQKDKNFWRNEQDKTYLTYETLCAKVSQCNKARRADKCLISSSISETTNAWIRNTVPWDIKSFSTGHAVAQLVEAPRYKPEGRGFDSRWCHWNFSLTSFWPHCGPGVYSASNINECQEYFLGGKGGRCAGLTTLPPSCADCLEIWEHQPRGTLRVSPGL